MQIEQANVQQHTQLQQQQQQAAPSLEQPAAGDGSLPPAVPSASGVVGLDSTSAPAQQ
jgi:hypothetical protein